MVQNDMVRDDMVQDDMVQDDMVRDDMVTVEDSQLSHLTRDRVKIPHNRRLPTRGHLLAVASTSSSDGMLTLDLIQEENLTLDLIQEEEALSPQGVDGPDCPRSKTDSSLCARAAATTEASGKSQSLPRETAVAWEETPSGFVKTPQPAKHLMTAEKNRCASMEEILSPSETPATKNRTAAIPRSPAAVPTGTAVPIGQLQELISQKLDKTERLLTEVQGEAQGDREAAERGKGKRKESVEETRVEAERLLREAAAAWDQAREVLEEVKELRALYHQLDTPTGASTTSSLTPLTPITSSNCSKQNPHRKSLM
ncbi:pleckstrin homology domain-containing family O member 1b [Diretmus argenteus]